MIKYKHKQITRRFAIIFAVIVLLGGVTAQYFISNRYIKAVDYDGEIKKLQDANKYYEGQAYGLRKKAETLEGEVALINAEKARIQVAIDQITARINQLTTEIKRLEKEIEDNREALGDVIAKIYLSSQISTVERLASSHDISDFIDDEARNQGLRDGLTTKLREIKTQRQAVSDKKVAQEKILQEQKIQMKAQADLEITKQKLLTETKGNEDSYRRMTAANNAQIDKLRAEQKRANCASMGGFLASNGECIRIGGNGSAIPPASPGNGGYPAKWANAPQDAYVDNWGLYTRECVSYVAWKVASTGRFVPHFGGAGNANQWPSTTARYGIKQGGTPVVGSAAVRMSGPYGHVMYVEAVHGDGTITVSDYNLGDDGLYRIYRRSAAGLIYIYF